ncbi:MAG: 2Fe-2S iron-sulfur cluster-binding protein [candidate division WOR-3 bacterium]|nr:2Fe-2S iron-sulfur cluster-binding protein [candidate division WOR-3 bacterium]MCX7756772.1 2Fe-2S iron-sulfur cluster-binding protein [candidate division WOR-3 bacterium]MDW7987735.1 2Fe-2S iron-sulfur cluster-binding protein [candidate division WOR-3 bacterium]
MPKIRINGIDFEFEKGTTLLEAAKFLGIEIPTLCYNEGLSPYGACRLCIVEISYANNPNNSKIVSSCTYPVEDNLIVRTHSQRVMRTRRLLLEMYLATCPQSKIIQDLASKWEVTQCRFRNIRYDDCIYCGLCVRMCKEQMDGKAISFVQRGYKRKITTPFDKKSETCRLCGGCIYICPACQARCQGPNEKEPICNACVAENPPCLEAWEDMKCYMDPCAWCEQEKREKIRNEKVKNINK